jgi:hypothetical protein
LLDGPGIESRWGRDFPQPSRPALGLTQPPINGYWSSLPGIKRPGRGVDHPPSSSTRVKEREELYLYSSSGSSWPVLGRTLPLPRDDLFRSLTVTSGSLGSLLLGEFRKAVAKLACKPYHVCRSAPLTSWSVLYEKYMLCSL